MKKPYEAMKVLVVGKISEVVQATSCHADNGNHNGKLSGAGDGPTCYHK